MKKLIAFAIMVVALTGCSFVDTGEVGLKRNFDKTIDTTEVLAGDFRQTVTGELLHFPIKDVSVEVNDLSPLAKDNSTMSDFDITVVYNLSPSSVSDFFVNKSQAFHKLDDDGRTVLMFEYVKTTARNAVYKTARNYGALEMNDSRAEIEQLIKNEIVETFAKEKLSGINVSQVQVRAMTPSAAVKASADALVRATNEKATKDQEVQIAEKEAQRIAALSQNKEAIAYMNAQANMEIAYAIREGRVNTIVIPKDFSGIVNVK